MITAIILFIIGFLILLFGTDDWNPIRDLIGFALIIGTFIYLCLLVP